MHCYGHAHIVGANDNNDPENWSAQNIFVTPRAENNFCNPSLIPQ